MALVTTLHLHRHSRLDLAAPAPCPAPAVTERRPSQPLARHPRILPATLEFRLLPQIRLFSAVFVVSLLTAPRPCA